MRARRTITKKSGFAQEIHVSWLYYGDIKIRDTFVYKHILTLLPKPLELPLLIDLFRFHPSLPLFSSVHVAQKDEESKCSQIPQCNQFPTGERYFGNFLD